MNEGQNDNLSSKSLLTHKPARTMSSVLVQYVDMKKRERETNRNRNHAERDRKKGREREMNEYVHVPAW